MLVERNGPKHVEELLECVGKAYPRESWVTLFATSHDLITFFKLHSNIFHVQSNIVDIIPYNLRRGAEPISTASALTPSTTSVTTTTSTSQPSSFSPPPLQASQEKQSLKQRVNSILLKTLADNTGRDRPAAATGGQESSPTHQSKEVTSPSKMRVLQSTRVVSSVKESTATVVDIQTTHKVISFDLEGVNIGSNNGEVRIALSLFSFKTHLYRRLWGVVVVIGRA